MNQLVAILGRKSVIEAPLERRGGRKRQKGTKQRTEAERAEADQKLEELNTLLENFAREEIPPEHCADVEGDTPLLLLLVQHRSFRICRRLFFCPEEGCQAREEIRTVNKYTTHLKCHHGVTEEDAADLFGHMVRKFPPSQVETVVKTDEGEEVRGGKQIHVCRYPGCNFVSAIRSRLEAHIKQVHQDMVRDVEALGWFWGVVHTMIRHN
jgi:hypothetical protein